MKNLFRSSLCAVAAAALLGSSMAQAQAGHKLPEIKYQEFKLSNGLQVLTHGNHRLPLVAVDLWYH